MKKGFNFLVLMVLMVCMVACSQNAESTNTDNSTTLKSTGIDPTGPANESRETIDVPILLEYILGFDLKDVKAMTVEKYENNSKTAVGTINDEEKIAELTNAISAFSIIHTTKKPPEKTVVYELGFSLTTGGQELLSITSMGSNNEFAVGGAFVDQNNLSPLELIIQNNPEISFDDIQEILEDSLKNVVS